MSPTDKKFEQILQELKLLNTQVNSLTERVDEIEENLNSKISDVNMSVFQARAELKEETKIIRNSLREAKKEISQVRDDQNVIIKFFNEEHVSLRKRVIKIEDKLNIPQNS